jgi:hypothetical protein
MERNYGCWYLKKRFFIAARKAKGLKWSVFPNNLKLFLTTSLNCPILWFEGGGKENFCAKRADFFGMKGN